ncbi:MAG: aminopeptidase, partial [Pedosphaera sp.]|nr:aminopeptidase [Pedosphaera sp.]
MSARFRFSIFLVLLVALTVVTARGELPFSFESTPGQLPKTVIPRHYAINIQPDLEKFMTHGSVVVDLEVVKPVKEIVLNADMQVTKATFHGQNETVPTDVTLKPKQDLSRQIVTLKLPNEVAPGKYQLRLEFIGQITEQAQGLFYVKYPTPSGKKVMLGTQMEPTDARRMFPCWDEPAFRASFQLTVTVPEKHLAISNTPIEHEKKLAGSLKEITFARTPSMASYLMVFVSGELEELKDKAEGVQIRIITTEGKKEQGRYALAATKKLLAYYNHYFGIKYPLPKLDQIAIPGGFSGAMENWGAITYNEGMLLYDPKTSSQHTKQQVFVTVAHEMAHQWFGNLVTTAWWNNLWLNEGFASWMEVKATDHFNPDWQMWLSANSEKSAVMSGDARNTTHPIQQIVNNESQANDAFDSITYQKGQAFLRMLESYVGEEEFRKGIHQYLADHLYANTTTADLWEALEKVSGKPIKTISVGWTEQPGLPVVKVKTDCVDGKQVVALEQERFTVQDPQAAPLLWKIPVGLMNAAHLFSIHAISFDLYHGQAGLFG